MHFILILFLTMQAVTSHALEDFDRQQILQRIRPIGSVQVSGQQAAPQEQQASAPAAKQLPGQATYEKYCVVCHQDGVAGAPKFRQEADWKPRMVKAKIDDLVAIAIKGLNSMPPKGTCTDCSDEEIKNAIQYMLPKS